MIPSPFPLPPPRVPHAPHAAARAVTDARVARVRVRARAAPAHSWVAPSDVVPLDAWDGEAKVAAVKETQRKTYSRACAEARSAAAGAAAASATVAAVEPPTAVGE